MTTKADTGSAHISEMRRVLVDAFIAVVVVAAFLVPLAEVYGHGLLYVGSAVAILVSALVLYGVWRTLPRDRQPSARARMRAAQYEHTIAGSPSSPAPSRGSSEATGARISSEMAGPVELAPHARREEIGEGSEPMFRATFELAGGPKELLPRLLVALDRAPHFRIVSTNEERSELAAEYSTVWTDGNLKVRLASEGQRTLLTATATPSAKILDAFEGACAASVQTG
jgi:hypothetical protein